ncbi:S1C family serine protease [Frankia sp. Cr2]|uniref:S1C family serine protease n=1 Tax=Frankia sp. Cr2 TaxID=3073932 RepID=UPI002AD4AED0|nr:trypsin-like peptidase domain-containing protein [Frankia sp. Cr2]
MDATRLGDSSVSTLPPPARTPPPLRSPLSLAPPPAFPPEYPPEYPAAFPPADTALGRDKPASSARRRLALGLMALSLATASAGAAVGAAVTTIGEWSPAVSAAAATSGSAAGASASNTIGAAAMKIEPSVVTLEVIGRQASAVGSGVVIRADGYILTNNHVIAGGGTISVRMRDGTRYVATLIGQNTTADLAVIKINTTGLIPATFADSAQVRVGDQVVAVGSPLGLSDTVTAGVVSALGRQVDISANTAATNGAVRYQAIQTDAALNPGNSGGALVNSAGELIGITSSIATTNGGTGASPGRQQSESGNIGVGFAITANQARQVADQIITAADR